MICTIRTRPFRISVSPYTGSVEVCFLHQTSFSACIFFLGQEMSKSSESDGFSPIPQTARCRVWQCLISRSGIPVNLQAVVLFKINCLHSLARNCI